MFDFHNNRLSTLTPSNRTEYSGDVISRFDGKIRGNEGSGTTYDLRTPIKVKRSKNVEDNGNTLRFEGAN